MGTSESTPKRTILITKPVCVINFQVYLLCEVKLSNQFKGINLQQLYDDNIMQFVFAPTFVCDMYRDSLIQRDRDSITCYFVKPEHKSKLLVYDDGTVKLRRLDSAYEKFGFTTDYVSCTVETLERIGDDVPYVAEDKEKMYVGDGTELPPIYIPKKAVGYQLQMK
jgi:hypothetical protein